MENILLIVVKSIEPKMYYLNHLEVLSSVAVSGPTLLCVQYFLTVQNLTLRTHSLSPWQHQSLDVSILGSSELHSVCPLC